MCVLFCKINRYLKNVFSANRIFLSLSPPHIRCDITMPFPLQHSGTRDSHAAFQGSPGRRTDIHKPHRVHLRMDAGSVPQVCVCVCSSPGRGVCPTGVSVCVCVSLVLSRGSRTTLQLANRSTLILHLSFLQERGWTSISRSVSSCQQACVHAASVWQVSCFGMLTILHTPHSSHVYIPLLAAAFASTLEQACVTTVEGGRMTKDIAQLIAQDRSRKEGDKCESSRYKCVRCAR